MITWQICITICFILIQDEKNLDIATANLYDVQHTRRT